MIGDEMISRSRKLLLQELRDSYWRKIYDQMIEEALYSRQSLEEEHLRIFQRPLSLFPLREESYATSTSLTAMTNYQFKHEIGRFLETMRDPI